MRGEGAGAQAQLGIDPEEVKVEEGLNLLVQSLRNKLQSEKQEIDQVLDPVETQLAQLDPVVAALPQAQQDLARKIRQRLDALNAAHKDMPWPSAAARRKSRPPPKSSICKRKSKI